MRQAITTATAAGPSAPVIVSFPLNFQVGFGCVVSGGATLTYKVQHTFDLIGDGTGGTVLAANATWFDNSTVTGKTANQDGNYAFPVYAIRLNVTAFTSGSVTMTVVSAGR